MSFEIGGKIIAVLDKRNGISASTNTPWSVQQYVIETHEQYPKKLCFDVFGEDKINQFNIQIGEELTVYFDINAREYQDGIIRSGHGKWKGQLYKRVSRYSPSLITEKMNWISYSVRPRRNHHSDNYISQSEDFANSIIPVGH